MPVPGMNEDELPVLSKYGATNTRDRRPGRLDGWLQCWEDTTYCVHTWHACMPGISDLVNWKSHLFPRHGQATGLQTKHHSAGSRLNAGRLDLINVKTTNIEFDALRSGSMDHECYP